MRPAAEVMLDLATSGLDARQLALVMELSASIASDRQPDAVAEKRDTNRNRRGLSEGKWNDLRWQVFSRDDHSCQYCGDQFDLTCDHIVPLNRGGTNDIENLTTACRFCNSSKGDKPLLQWRGQ